MKAVFRHTLGFEQEEQILLHSSDGRSDSQKKTLYMHVIVISRVRVADVTDA